MFWEMIGQKTDEMKDESWLQGLAFIVYFIAQFTDLNLKFLRHTKNSCVSFCAPTVIFSPPFGSLHDSHLELLPKEFQKIFYFRSFECKLAIFSAPFTFKILKFQKLSRQDYENARFYLWFYQWLHQTDFLF